MYQRISNNCAVCGRELQPFDEHTFTAHEYKCYKANRNKIPDRDVVKFNEEFIGEQRSLAAKRGVKTRRRKQWLKRHGFTDGSWRFEKP